MTEPVVSRNPTEQEQEQELKAKQHRRRVRALRSFLFRLISLVLVVYVLLFHIVGLLIMPSGDMYPRLDAGDMLLYYRLTREFRSQDIVVIEKAVNTDFSAVPAEIPEPNWFRKALNWLGFKDPAAPETRTYVCRVIGAPGDKVEITDERGLTVNGNTLIETNIFYPTRAYEGYVEYPLTLGPGEYFVLADFRNGGTDSRYFGVVRAEEIRGVLITILRRNNL